MPKKKNQNIVKRRKDLWTVSPPGLEPLEKVGIGRLIDIALKEGYPPGDYIFEASKLVEFLRTKGYGVVYDPTGGTEAIELDVLDPQ